MTIKQWVNLDKDPEYAKDKDIGSIDRCGKINLKVSFANDKAPVDFKSKITPDGKNVTYTKQEEARNPNFKLSHNAWGICKEKEYLLEESIQLPAAGGNKYKIEAKDSDGKTVNSVEVEAWRKLYYQVMCMDDGTNKVPPSALGSMEKHAKDYFIALQQVGGTTKIPYIKTLTETSINTLAADLKKHFSLSPAHKKVGIAVIFSENIADKLPSNFNVEIPSGKTSPDVVISPTDITIILPYFLWHGLVDSDDIAKEWFTSGAIGVEDPKSKTTQSCQITRASVSIAGPKLRAYGGYHQVKVSRDAALDTLLKVKNAKIFIDFNYNSASWTNGFSWSPNNIDMITCARRVVWEDMPANTTEYTWNHEVGHRFGMVAYGDRKGIRGANKLPDGPPTLYGENRGVNDKNHAGPHCEKGANYNATSKQWSGAPGCVMFGANGIGNNHAPNDYCNNCKVIVKKLDLA